MSTEKKPTVSKKALPLRKATFLVNGKGTDRIFTPVNKRAKKWAKKVGKRTRLTVADMKAIKATKKVKLALYTPAGTLQAIR